MKGRAHPIWGWIAATSVSCSVVFAGNAALPIRDARVFEVSLHPSPSPAAAPVFAILAAPPAPEQPDAPAPKPKPAPAAKTQVKPVAKPAPPKPKADATSAQPTAVRKMQETAPKQQPKPAAPNSAPSASAAHKAPVAKSGGPSPAVYAKTVMRQIQKLRRASGLGQGRAVVGFTIGKSGALAATKLLQSSGNAALDQAALAHIAKAAPFAPPPDGAASFSFEFVGR